MRKTLVTVALLFMCGLSGFGITESETMDSGEKEKTRSVVSITVCSTLNRTNQP